MNPLQDEITEKKTELRRMADDMKTCTILIKDDLEKDSHQLGKVAIAYEHSGGLLKRTNESLDRLLCQSEVRVAIYVAGSIILVAVLVWKFVLKSAEVVPE